MIPDLETLHLFSVPFSAPFLDETKFADLTTYLLPSQIHTNIVDTTTTELNTLCRIPATDEKAELMVLGVASPTTAPGLRTFGSPYKC
jgi:hypothetical protein